MSKTLKSILKAALFASIGLIVLFLVYRSNNTAYQEECAQNGIPAAECNLLEKVIDDVASANYFWVIVALLLFTLSNISRALRWNIMLEPLGYKPRFVNSLGSVLIAYLSNLGLPRSGEFVRAGVLSQYEGYAPDKVMGTIVLDRIADVISLLIMIGLAIVFSYNDFYQYLVDNADMTGLLQKLTNPVTIGVGLGGVCLLSYLFFKYKSRIAATKIGGKVVGLINGLKEGVLSITKLKRPWAFLFHSVLIWLCYFLMNWLIFYAFEPTSHLGPVAGLVVFVFGTLGIVFPSPGGMGSYHYLVGEGLGLYGIGDGDAFSFANIIFFSVQLFCNVLLGVLALIILPLYNSKRKDG